MDVYHFEMETGYGIAMRRTLNRLVVGLRRLVRARRRSGDDPCSVRVTSARPSTDGGARSSFPPSRSRCRFPPRSSTASAAATATAVTATTRRRDSDDGGRRGSNQPPRDTASRTTPRTGTDRPPRARGHGHDDDDDACVTVCSATTSARAIRSWCSRATARRRRRARRARSASSTASTSRPAVPNRSRSAAASPTSCGAASSTTARSRVGSRRSARTTDEPLHPTREPAARLPRRWLRDPDDIDIEIRPGRVRQRHHPRHPQPDRRGESPRRRRRTAQTLTKRIGHVRMARGTD